MAMAPSRLYIYKGKKEWKYIKSSRLVYPTSLSQHLLPRQGIIIIIIGLKPYSCVQNIYIW